MRSLYPAIKTSFTQCDYSSAAIINSAGRGRPDLCYMQCPQLWDYNPQHTTAGPALWGSVASSVICNLCGCCPSISLSANAKISPTAAPQTTTLREKPLSGNRLELHYHTCSYELTTKWKQTQSIYNISGITIFLNKSVFK